MDNAQQTVCPDTSFMSCGDAQYCSVALLAAATACCLGLMMHRSLQLALLQPPAHIYDLVKYCFTTAANMLIPDGHTCRVPICVPFTCTPLDMRTHERRLRDL
jgi:hypothetical protein